MKLRKIFAGIAAASIAVTACASFSASADDNKHVAYLMFADTNWLWSNWHNQLSGEGYGIDAEITKDGTYTVSITSESVEKNANGENAQGKGGTDYASGTVVFCVDIPGLMKTKKFNAEKEKKKGVTENGKYSEKDIKCKLKSIKQDGKALKFDASKILYGNIEDDTTNYRIEIYNTYGDTKDTEPIDPLAVQWSKSLEVTFDISGLGSGEAKTTQAANETPATTAAVGGGADTTANTSTNTNTGAETGLALIGLALAGGAIVLTKKKK